MDIFSSNTAEREAAPVVDALDNGCSTTPEGVFESDACECTAASLTSVDSPNYQQAFVARIQV